MNFRWIAELAEENIGHIVIGNNVLIKILKVLIEAF
jgi:hypothetical protein